MELNREAVFDRGLEIVDIAKKVVGYFDGGLHVIRSDQNSEKLVSAGVFVHPFVHPNMIHPCASCFEELTGGPTLTSSLDSIQVHELLWSVQRS